MPSPIPRSLIAQDDPLWGETKRDPPEGGSIPGRLGVRARTPRPRGCTFLRVFNNSPSRDRSWCTVLTGGPFRGPFFRFSGGGNVPPLGGEKWPPRGPLFHPPTKGPKRPPNGPPKRPRNHPPHPLGGYGGTDPATLRCLSPPSLGESEVYNASSRPLPEQRRSDTTCQDH